MATINVSLSEPLKDWVETRARDAHCETTSDYVRDLIQRDRDDEDAKAELELLIDEGFASGISERSIDEIFAAVRGKAVP